MPQSRSVFAVSLQVHPELLERIMPLLHLDVNAYYCANDNSSCTGGPSLEILLSGSHRLHQDPLRASLLTWYFL
jgi:hypothetical protein